MLCSRESSRGLAAAGRLFSFVALVAFAGAATAQNLPSNPRFNGNIVPWLQALSSAPQPNGAGSIAYDAAHDYDGSPTSGSLQVNVTAVPAAGSADAAVGAVQCVAIPVPLQPVTSANYGARLRVPVGAPIDGALNASVGVSFFSDTACATPIENAGEGQGRVLTAGVPDDAFWYDLSDPSFVPVTSLAAGSVQVRLAVTKLADSGAAATVQFDSVYISVNGTTPVYLQNFEVE